MVEAGSQAKKKIKLMEFKHPKYYQEMRKRAKEFQKHQATSENPQAKSSSNKRQASSPVAEPSSNKPESTSS